MAGGFSYTLLHDWFGEDEGRNSTVLSGLLPHQKLLLLSDGSMTLDLELLTGARVSVEMKFTGVAPLSRDAALYLREEPGKDAIERDVWLRALGRRLLYAHSLIPEDRIDRALRTALDEEKNEPLGRVLASRKIFFSKERLEIGVVRCEEASAGLSLPKETALLARRYILFNREERWIIKAAVTEIFSPEVIAVAWVGTK